jgi:hypothetical protein
MKLGIIFLMSFISLDVLSIETLEYDVIKKENKFEIRQYKNHITASISFKSKEEFDKLAFRTLANYIFGNNISMTSPVLTQGENIGMTSPVLTEENQSVWTMSFSMPKRYSLENLPTPSNKNIVIKEEKEKLIAAITFSGFMSDSNFLRNERKLTRWLKNNRYEYKPSLIRAGYNPPWTLPFFRKNEVMAVIK